MVESLYGSDRRERRRDRVARRDVAERIRRLRCHVRAVDGETGDVVAGRRSDRHRGAVTPVDVLARRRDGAVGAAARGDRVAHCGRHRGDVVPVHAVGVVEVLGLQHHVAEAPTARHVRVDTEARRVDEGVVDVVAHRVRVELDAQVVPAAVREAGGVPDVVPAQVVPHPEAGAVDKTDDRIADDAAASVNSGGPHVGATGRERVLQRGRVARNTCAPARPVGSDVQVAGCEGRPRGQIVLASLRVVEAAGPLIVGGADRQLQPVATVEGRLAEPRRSIPIGVPGARCLRRADDRAVIEGLDRRKRREGRGDRVVRAHVGERVGGLRRHGRAVDRETGDVVAGIGSDGKRCVAAELHRRGSRSDGAMRAG